jgi:PAS domain S-box-containing protein
MILDPEKREYERFEHKEPLKVSYQNINTYYRAEMVNYGRGGICIESETPFQRGKIVHIRALQSPSKIPFLKSEADVNAAVRFCQKKGAADSHFHRIGVQFLDANRSHASNQIREKTHELRKRAEAFLDNQPEAIRDSTPEDVHLLVHELHVHQIELEMQNDELRRAQAEIESSRNRYSFLYDAAPIGYFTLDQYGKILEVNLTGATYLGVERTKLVNQSLSRYISRRHQNVFRQHRLDVLQTLVPRSCEIQLKAKNGTPFYVRMNSIAVQDADYLFNRLLTAVTDIDAQIQMAQEKKKLEYELQQAQKMKAIGTLAGGIAHNFNNLLMGIQGRISIMLFELNADHPHCDHLQAIEKTIKSASKLTRELLGFARGGKYRIKPIDLNRLLTNTSDTFFPNRKDIEIHTQVANDLWTIEVDRGQIEQVLINLYMNAIQAMPDGGKLSLQTENVTLDHTSAGPFGLPAGRYVRVTVTDTGVGMDDTTRQRIFEPFFTTKDVEKGAGLGLSFVYGVILNHKGSVSVTSQLGEGAAFHLYLPASYKTASSENKPINTILRGTETVLLVDDEDVILEVGRQMLIKLGYEVLAAQSGAEALELYRKFGQRIALIILDLIMPEMRGGETFDRLLHMNAQVKVLLSSGFNINGEAADIIKRGCRGFIQKPFNLRDLSIKLREILDN